MRDSKNSIEFDANLLRKLLPASVRRAIVGYIRAVVQSDSAYIRSSESSRLYFQSHPDEDSYCIKPNVPAGEGLPVPPEELWVGYDSDAQAYLSNGRKEVAEMARIVEKGGGSLAEANRVLEIGCAAGRMLRHVAEFAPKAELWGVDISARHIQWCVDNLTPGTHFATTTTIFHLPFEDRYFDFIFCGSVFTHVEDMRPSGRLFITVHDEHTVKHFDASYRHHRTAQYMREQPVYAANKNALI